MARLTDDERKQRRNTYTQIAGLLLMAIRDLTEHIPEGKERDGAERALRNAWMQIDNRKRRYAASDAGADKE